LTVKGATPDVGDAVATAFGGELLPDPVYVAVNVVAVAGEVTLWVAAPPSDQEAKVYVVPPDVCVAGALIECTEPMIAVTVYGVAWVVPSKTTCNPDGTELRERVTVRGWRATLVVELRPFESVAISWSSR
jgi:hypothetical protein